MKQYPNYDSFISIDRDAKEKGFHDNLYLELDTYHNGGLHEAILQELSAANIFLVLKTGEIVTPSLKRGTILPGKYMGAYISSLLFKYLHICTDYLLLYRM